MIVRGTRALVVLTVVSALGLAGCSTVQSRNLRTAGISAYNLAVVGAGSTRSVSGCRPVG